MMTTPRRLRLPPLLGEADATPIGHGAGRVPNQSWHGNWIRRLSLRGRALTHHAQPGRQHRL